jgi:hypothetical protein
MTHFGEGSRLSGRILRDNGLDVETIHDWRDVTSRRSLEPGEDHLDELRAAVVGKK